MEGDFGEVKVRVVSSNQTLFAVTAKQLRTIPALSRNQYPLEKVGVDATSNAATSITA
jgi:hypothetical protein